MPRDNMFKLCHSQKCSEKNNYLGKQVIFGPKIVIPHNSGSARCIFFVFVFQFYEMKEAISTNILNINANILVRGNLGTEMAHPHNSGSTLRIFFKLSTVEEGGERARGIWKLCCVFESNLVWGKRVIRTAKMKPPHNSRSVAVRGFF